MEESDMIMQLDNKTSEKSKTGFRNRVYKDFIMNRYVYLLALPVVAYYIIFHYAPMYGAIIAFKDFRPGAGIMGSPWVGLENFRNYFSSVYFWRLLRNTFLLSFYNLIFGFPVPILFALTLNELRNKRLKSVVQTITYLPHFISMVVICGMIVDFTNSDGIINTIIEFFGGERSTLLTRSELFRTIYAVSDIWVNMGWGSIVYLAALSNIDTTLYEASIIDGAGRLKQAIHITLPGIMPTVTIMLILAIGSLLSVGWEKVLLLYTPVIYETADVISTFVYRRGIEKADYSYSTAVGLFNSVINFVLIFLANTVSRKFSETSLW